MPDHLLLTSSESIAFAGPRACQVVGTKRFGARKDLLLVRCDPPWEVPVEHETGTTNYLLLASRLQGYALPNSTEWPVPVHIVLPLTMAAIENRAIVVSDIRHYAWGEVTPDPSVCPSAS